MRIAATAALAGVLALTGCGDFQQQLSNPERPEMSFALGAVPAVPGLSFRGDGHGRLAVSPAAVAAFAADYLRRGHGPLAVQGAPADVAAAARMLVADGVPVSDIRPVRPGARGGVLLSFPAYSAAVPRCGAFRSEDHLFGLYDPSNRVSSEFGCSTQRDLGLMVQDPRDLVRPRAVASGMSAGSLAGRVNDLNTYAAPPEPTADVSAGGSGGGSGR